MVKPRVIHVIRFRRVNQHAIRALCNCGWHSPATTRRAFTRLAGLVTAHTAANLAVIALPQS